MMTGYTTADGRTVHRLVILTTTLLVAATGTAAAMGGGSRGTGTMGGGWGLFGASMGLWGLLWMGLLIAVPLVVGYSLLTRGAGEKRPQQETERPLSLLRERYARGEIDEEELRRRRNQLERTE